MSNLRFALQNRQNGCLHFILNKDADAMTHLSKITPDKLHALTNMPKTLHHISQKVPGGSIMQGDFLHTQQVSGIWVHACRILELQDAVCSFERPPGLSFSFIFEGEAPFAIADKEHCFKASAKPNTLQCAAICLAQDEIISRKIRKGNTLYKLNISIDRANLEARCQGAKERNDIKRLFQNHGAIYQWQISSKLEALIYNLMTIIHQEDFLQRLHIESYATEVLFHALSSLKKECAKEQKATATGKSKVPSSCRKNSSEAKKLREKIDILLDQTIELKAIAQQLNMSVSTLQRKFKATYGFTVIEYIRRQKLKNARNKIVMEGISLTEAANLAGYKHVANFVTAFRKMFGTTPHAYCKDVSY